MLAAASNALHRNVSGEGSRVYFVECSGWLQVVFQFSTLVKNGEGRYERNLEKFPIRRYRLRAWRDISVPNEHAWRCLHVVNDVKRGTDIGPKVSSVRDCSSFGTPIFPQIMMQVAVRLKMTLRVFIWSLWRMDLRVLMLVHFCLENDFCFPYVFLSYWIEWVWVLAHDVWWGCCVENACTLRQTSWLKCCSVGFGG